MQPALCALGAVLLSFDSPWLAIPAAFCALAAAAIPSADGSRSFALARHPAAAQVVFGIGFLRGLYWLLFEQSLVPPQRLEGFRGLTLLAFIVGSAYLCVHLRASLEKARFWVLVVLFAVLALAMEPRFVPLLAVLIAAIAIGRSSTRMALRNTATADAARDRRLSFARVGSAFTAELAALFVLYQPYTWEEITRSSARAFAVLAAVLGSLLSALVSPRWAARGSALAAAVCAAAAGWSGRIGDGFWLASALLCAAAAAFSLARLPSRAAAAAR